MLGFAAQLMSRRDAPMRALAANAGAHFPLIVRSRFCLCLSGSAFMPFAKEFFQISQGIAGTGYCLVHALLEDHLPPPIQILNLFQGGHRGPPCVSQRCLQSTA